GDRGPRLLHLCQPRAVLFLPPRHAPGRTRLWPTYQCDRASRLTARRLATAIIPTISTADGPAIRIGLPIPYATRRWLKRWGRAGGASHAVVWSSAHLGRAAA